MFIYTTLLCLTPPYLSYLLQPSSSRYNTPTPQSTHNHWAAPLFSSLQLTTGASCDKHSNGTVLSPSLHSKTHSWTLLLTVVAALRDVLLFLPSCPFCCCLCPIMFVQCFMILPCCVATMLCRHVLLPCYVVVLGISLCSVVLSLLP
jgi:hypothetical protein